MNTFSGSGGNVHRVCTGLMNIDLYSEPKDTRDLNIRWMTIRINKQSATSVTMDNKMYNIIVVSDRGMERSIWLIS